MMQGLETLRKRRGREGKSGKVLSERKAGSRMP